MKVLKDFFNFIKPAILCCVIMIGFLCFFTPAVVDGSSMYPTLKDSDILILKRNVKTLNYGDIVAIKSPALHMVLCKRIIGQEGDKVQITSDGLFVNDQKLEEDYIYEQNWLQNQSEINIVVPKDCVFVLGDNRNNSSDSRSLGCISKVQVLGVMVLDLTNIFQINSEDYQTLLYILWLILGIYYIVIYIVSQIKNHRDNKENSSNINKDGT